MTIKHHLDEATLMSFSAGALPEALATVVACHLEVCPTCRKQHEDLDMLGGALLESVDPEPLSDGLSERMAAHFREDNVRSFPVHRVRARRTDRKPRGELPKSLQRLVGRSLVGWNGSGWRPASGTTRSGFQKRAAAACGCCGSRQACAFPSTGMAARN